MKSETLYLHDQSNKKIQKTVSYKCTALTGHNNYRSFTQYHYIFGIKNIALADFFSIQQYYFCGEEIKGYVQILQ